MFRGTLMRGGVFILMVTVLWLPLSSTTARVHDSTEPSPGITSPELGGGLGWIESLLTLLRNLAGADESGGTFEPNGQPGEQGTCGGVGQEPCPEPTTTTTTPEPGGSGLTALGGF